MKTATNKIFAEKVKMMQLWKDDKVVPVTVLNYAINGDAAMDLKAGDKVRVSGTSKGKGFQGVVKRHGFHGGPKSHGQKNRLRAPGSIGPTAPQRVIKGKKMAGNMGNDRVTIRNMSIVEIHDAEKEIFLKGAVPGRRGSRVELIPKLS